MTMKLKTILALSTALASGLAATGAFAMSPVYVETQTGCNFDMDEGCRTTVYANTSVKINDRYTFTPETSFDVNFKPSPLNVDHKFLRFLITDKSVAKVGDWVFGISYRYSAPTTELAQEQATLGGLLFRPQVTNSWSTPLGKLTLLMREGLGFGLIKRPHPRSSGAGNSPFTQAFEFLPNLDVTDNIYVGLNQTLANVYFLAPVGGSSFWAYQHYQSVEVGYSHPKYTWGTTIALGIENDSGKVGTDKVPSYSFWTAKTSDWYVLIGRTF